MASSTQNQPDDHRQADSFIGGFDFSSPLNVCAAQVVESGALTSPPTPPLAREGSAQVALQSDSGAMSTAYLGWTASTL